MEGRWLIVGLAGFTYLLSLPMFEPRAVWLFGYVAFVPWLVAIVRARRAGWVYGVSFLFGTVFWLTHWRWLYPVSPVVYVTACLILGSYFPLAVWPIRHLARARRFSLTFVFPVVWTAHELFHSRGTLSTPWCLLSHSQVRLPVMIQIADLVGALGVSFVVAMVNGWVADMVLNWIAHRHMKAPWRWPRPILVASLATWSVMGATLVYGWARLARQPAQPGPRVAVLQGDFLLSPGMDVNARVIQDPPPLDDELDPLIRQKKEAFNADKRLVYLRLLEQAARASPDLFVLPESPWNMVLNREYRESPLTVEQDDARLQHEEFVRLVQRYQTPIVVGALTQKPQPPGAYPQVHEYNSAFVYHPGQPEPARYDKINLVLLGEYLPFRYSRRFFWLYRFLNDGFWNPWGRGGKEYVTTPGTEFTTFAIQARSRGGATFHFGVAICYEDAIAQEYRKFVVGPDGRKRADFMLTISNVGWFGHGSQQAQHLAACTFRAIENRVWMARAVNTGISGFIDSNGAWYDLAGGSDHDPRPGGIDCRTAEVRSDPRVTFYSRHGDGWAWVCMIITLIALADAMITRWLR